MSKLQILKLVIQQNTYDILSADTGFYAYLEDSRLYYTFNRLIHEDDLHLFWKKVETLDGKGVLLRLKRVDGSSVSYYTTIKEGNTPDQLQVTLIDIEKLVASEKETDSQLSIFRKLVELHNNDLFIYNPQEDQVKLISKFNVAPVEKTMSLEVFEELLKKHSKEEKYDDVVEFMNAIRKGKRYFSLCVNGNIVKDTQEGTYSVIRGASVYDAGERILATGYIQIEEEAVDSKIRKPDIDSLTGVLSKSEITNLAIRAIDIEKQQNVSIAIVDVDHFKKVNDTYGHLCGDETLKKVAAIMEAEVGDRGVVGRIGGDEFFILFYDAYDLETARERLRSIKTMTCTSFPVSDETRPAITLSIGCASYPKDADNYMDLFALADFALYRAKEKGRNRYIIYDREKHGTLAEIHKTTKLETRINSRGDMSKGDIMCVIMDKVFSDEVYPLDKLLDDYIENFEPQRITIYDAEQGKVLHMAGAKVLSKKVIEETQDYIHGEYWQKKDVYEDTILNDISMVANSDQKTYEKMKKQEIISSVYIKFQDKNGLNCLLSLESVGKKITWSNDHMHYYRIMARILSMFAMK